jgi:Uri superfamily endonuclease
MLNEYILNLGGDYVLLLRVADLLQIEVGRSGEMDIPSGWAVYLGSARGPGGLKARLARHLKPAGQKRAHWHIDYLNAAVPIEEIWWLPNERRRECRWADITSQIGQPVAGFGASDCRCESHLFSLGIQPQVQQVWESLNEASNGRLRRTVILQEKT